MSDGIWVIDPDTNKPTLLPYDSIDPEVMPSILVPTGGFCYPADQFLMLPLPKVPFYIEPWLPKQGKALFYAPAKSGKSFLAVQMARCIGTGSPFLGMPTNKGRVLYLQFELGTPTLQGRMRDTKQSYDNVYVGTSFSLKLDTKAGQKMMQNALAVIQPDVVMLDPLYKILNGEENESHDVLCALNFLDSLIEDYACSILLIHHAGKDVEAGSRGSSVLNDWPDSIIRLKRTSKIGEVPLRANLKPTHLRHASGDAEALPIVLENFEFSVDAGKAKDTIESKVFQFMKSHDLGAGIRPKQILDAGIGCNRTVHEALSNLVKAGSAEQASRGLYRVNREEYSDED